MDMVDKETRSRIMSRIRSSNTTPERALGSILRKEGVSYRLNYGQEKADLAIPKKKVAIFVDGCFWHMCPKHCRMPASNKAYWKAKLEKNAQRDRLRTRQLQKRGWIVIRVWEHDILKPEKTLRKILPLVK